MKHDMQAAGSLGTADQLDAIRMSEHERRAAKATLRQAEKFAHFLFWLDANLRHGVRLVARGIEALFHPGKPAGGRPVLH